MSRLENPALMALRRWLWAAAAALLVLTGCAYKGSTDGQTPPSELDSAAPGLAKCDKKGGKTCATAANAADALLLLSAKKSITVADICPRPGSSDGQTPPSQLDSDTTTRQRLNKGFDVLNEVIARTQCVQACGGGPECCTCCAQPSRDPSTLAAQCRKTAPPR